ncbi:MAG TPA: acyl carrier protein [Solirubrobacteraceae bacterium]
MSDSRRERIRGVLRDHARLPIEIDSLSDQDDLFQAGMSSHASVNVMLALEDTFDIEFPDQMLKRSVFESVSGIEAAIDELLGQTV